ncbi:MAG: TRAP transporter small permease subunit [Candidatus Aminicenantes bacterium]|nr:TRAP transporter small permease subunit [Candidatus Aminicenantes bacterium]
MIGEALKQKVDKALEWALILLMGANVLNVLWQVFTRFVLRHPSSFTEELARFLLIWVGLLGASYASGKKMHLAIEVVVDRLKGKSRIWMEVFIQSFVFLFALLVMVIGGIRLVTITLLLGQTSAALSLKLGYVYLVIPLSGLLILFYSLLFLISALYKLRQSQDLVGERSVQEV